MKQRLRRQTQRTRLPVETLEPRVVPAATGSVSGVAFIDANGDGIKNFLDLDHSGASDPTLARNNNGSEDELIVKGVTVHLIGVSGAAVGVNAKTTTDQNGKFSFTVVPSGTYALKGDANAAISGTLGNGVTVVVLADDPLTTLDNESVTTQDLPIDGVVVTGDLLLNVNTSITEFSQDSLKDFALPSAGTGRSTGINEAPTLRNKTVENPTGQPTAINVDPTTTTTVDLTGVFNDSNIVTSQVQIHTSGGDVNVDLLDDEAPQTVQNFYNYVNSGAYDNSIFHRLASGFVLQGGGFKYNAKDSTATPPVTAASITAITTNSAVKNEFNGTKRSNLADTIAMAKIGPPTGQPPNDASINSATNQFFFNLADNSSNLDSQNGGFTVFGRLVGPDDSSVINSLASTTTKDESTATGVTDASVRGALGQIPLKNYTGTTFPTDTTASNFLRITGVDTIVRDEELTYSVVSNSDEALFLHPDKLIKDNRLNLEFLNATVRGTATIVIRATDKHGLATGTEGNPDAVFLVTANAQPVFTPDSSVNVAENTTAVLTVTATDADLPAQTVTYSLPTVGGADQALFNITSGGVLTFVSAPDFENPADADLNNVYVVQVQASDGIGGTAKQTINVTVTGVNDNSPTFTSASSKDVAENTTAVLAVTATDADLPAQTVTYSLPTVGGADQALFSITSGGVLTFKSAPDFENSADADHDNIYVVDVQADDGNGSTLTQTITVTVTDMNEPPVFTSDSSVNVAENTTAVLTVTATDADLPAQTVTYSLPTVGGADQALFNITSGGVLTFVSAPDFENPADADLNNVYVVQVQASDGIGGTAKQTINVTVTGVNDNSPTFTSASSKDVAENTTAVLTVTATDADLPTQTVTYSLPTVGGADQALFNITSGGVLTFVSAPDFENPADADLNNVYVVQVQASDGIGGTAKQTINVTVTPVNEFNPEFTSPSTVNVDGSTTDVLTVTATDADLPTQTVTYSIVGGADLESFSITEGGVLTFNSLPAVRTYQVEILALVDGNGGFSTQLITVNVGSV